VIDVLVKHGVTDKKFAAKEVISPYALERR
jgi:hypothetical protein